MRFLEKLPDLRVGASIKPSLSQAELAQMLIAVWQIVRIDNEAVSASDCLHHDLGSERDRLPEVVESVVNHRHSS